MTVGLALGSGSARGLAHFGVIKALEEHNIEVNYIAGCSFGSVVGAAIASNSHASLEAAYRKFDRRKVFSLLDIVLPRSGIIDGQKAVKFVAEHYEIDDFDELSIKFVAIATDLANGSEVILDSGSVSKAIRASSALPGLLTPVKWDDTILADGGLVNPVPVSALKTLGADQTIAVNLNYNLLDKHKNKPSKKELNKNQASLADKINDKLAQTDWIQRLSDPLSKLDYPALNSFKDWLKKEPLPGIFDVMLASVDIMETQLAQLRLQVDKPDVLIQPELGHIQTLDFHKADEIIDEGYRATVEAIKKSEFSVR
jgi:NTE family protein